MNEWMKRGVWLDSKAMRNAQFFRGGGGGGGVCVCVWNKEYNR